MRTYQAKTTHDLLENTSITFETLRETWRNAEVEIESSPSSRARCRICGKRIEKGEQRVVSASWDLVSLYNAFWSMKVYAHLECYQKLVSGSDPVNSDGRDFPKKSPYKEFYYCPVCEKWIPKVVAADGHCIYCGKQLRSTPRDKRYHKLREISGQIRCLIRLRGQTRLDPWLSGLVVSVRKEGRVEYYAAL